MVKQRKSACQKKIGVVMHEWGKHKLRMGRSGKTVRSQKQALAIGYAECRTRRLKIKRKSAGK